MTDTWNDNPNKWIQDPENLYRFKRPASETELENLKLTAQSLGDSLILYGENEQNTTYNILYFLGQDSIPKFWEVAKTSKDHQSGVLLEDLMLRADLAYKATLNYISAKTSAPIDCSYWFPIVSAEKSAILPGQIYKAEVFLSQYSNSKMYERNTTIKVNGKPFPIKDGLVHFSQRYTTPGEKKYKVDIEIKNPVTKEVISFKKEFALLVVDSCQ